MINFAFHIVGIVSFVRAQTDKPNNTKLNIFSVKNPGCGFLPAVPELVEVVLALVGALQDGALVQHVVNNHGVNGHLELPEQLPVSKPQLGDDSRPGW